MKLKTTIPIDFTTWLDQATRFAKIADVLISSKFPIKDVESQPATIQLDILKPLVNGFEGRVRYIQTIEQTRVVDKEVEQTKLDENGNIIVDENGNEVKETVIVSETIVTQTPHTVVEYIERMTVQDISAALDQVQPLIPSDVVGYMERQKWCIKFIFLQTVVQRLTFNLPANKWQ